MVGDTQEATKYENISETAERAHGRRKTGRAKRQEGKKRGKTHL